MSEQWKPISTAPKDGTWILIYQPASMWQSKRAARQAVIRVAYWHQPANLSHDGFWLGGHTYRPTHWMPLPAPPGVRTADDPRQAEPAQ